MKIINWNISWLHDIDKKIIYLQKITEGQPFVIILQEVTEISYKKLNSVFSSSATVAYSLNYRKPGKFDTNSRKLGIAIIISKDIFITDISVLERTVFPERTLYVDAVWNNTPLKILGLHSITGCQHKKAKSIQFYSFAEAVDFFKPDIVGIDANEPKVDHYDIHKMLFYDNFDKGNGCKTFFETLSLYSLDDAFSKNYDTEKFIFGEALATSHKIGKTDKKVRYDFLFLNNEKFRNYSCRYEYEQAIQAGSDHASVIVTL